VNKRSRSLVVLAVVAAIVAALVWLDQRRPSTDEASRQRQRLLPDFSRARASEIVLERRGATTHLVHEASGWWLAGPPRRRAEDSEVDSLLAVLEYGEIDRRIADVDPALRRKLGLDSPRVVVRVLGHTLAIGGDDPGRGVYVVRDGEPGAFVVEHRLVETADLDARLWLSMRLCLSSPSEAARIAFGGWTLEHHDGWRLTAPVRARAADAKVDALVQALERTRAIAYDPTGAPFSGGTELALDDRPQARVRDDRALREDGALLTFRKIDLNLLQAPVAAFYERRLFPLRLDDIVAVDVGPFELRRESAAWRIVAPLAAARPVKDEAVRSFLEPLLAAEAHAFSPAALAAAHPTRVRLATRDEEVVASVDGARARRAGETVTLELAAPLELATTTF
jgi:hypothetical protein